MARISNIASRIAVILLFASQLVCAVADGMAQPVSTTSFQTEPRTLLIKGRPAEEIKQGNDLASKRFEWVGDAILCSLKMDKSCWTAFPQEADAKATQARSDRSKIKRSFGADFACSVIKGYTVNNCYDDLGHKSKTASATSKTSSSATTSPTPARAAGEHSADHNSTATPSH